MNLDVLLHVIGRFLHIGSVILLLGGIVYARQIVSPVIRSLPTDTQLTVASGAQSRFKGALWSLLALIVLSGLYNYFTYAGPKHTSTYQMWFGIKFLLVLHVLATAILWSTTPYREPASFLKADRRLFSLMISGFAIVLISAYLRSLTQRGL